MLQKFRSQMQNILIFFFMDNKEKLQKHSYYYEIEDFK